MDDTLDRAVPGGESSSGAGEPVKSGGVLDRRAGLDRRGAARFAAGAAEGESLDRRRGAGRRLSDFTRSAEEGEFTKEQFLFVQAVEAFKRANGKAYPSWTDVLEVIRLLGYRKTMRSEIELRSAEDWQEAWDTEAGVRPDGWERRVTGALPKGRRRGEAA